MATNQTHKRVLTQFSKALKGSIAVSFSRSARDNCDKSCRAWNACYASRIERIYHGLNAKLAKHYRNGPLWVINRAIAEVQTINSDVIVPWARVSVDGSVPSKKKLGRQWPTYIRRLRILVQLAKSLGADWHFPVESMSKARSYRAELGDLLVVRRTSQASTASELLRQTDHRSWIVGRIHNGAVTKDETARNVATARQIAEEARQLGQSCVVCPAIASDSKCGKCRACASDAVDIVLYPFHA